MNDTITVAVLDPNDPVTARSVNDALLDYRSVVIPCLSRTEMLAAVTRQRINVAIIKLSKPLDEDFRTLSQIQNKAPQTEVIFVAYFDDELMRAWMEVIQQGAYEFLPKPLDREELRCHLVHAAEKHHPVKPRRLWPATYTKRSSALGI
jgi:DNA-binding NtrC family response regulator